MSETNERYELVNAPGPENDAPAYWIQDSDTVEDVDDDRGDYYGTMRLYGDDLDGPGFVRWQAEMLDTEAAIVLTVRREDAATIVARILAALNGGD